MADNFDSNVALRKPDVSERFRPAHPWDISPHAFETDSEPDHERATPEHLVSSKNNLSDVIDIHSNFCKLDNDVSDYLFAKLSPSAQSVYLRLYRQSFGWNRNWAAESLPKLTRACNLSLQTVRKAILELELLGCICREFSDYHKATVYRVYLPSEIGIGKNSSAKNTIAFIGGLYSNILPMQDHSRSSQKLFDKNLQFLNSKREENKGGRDRFLEVNRIDSGGQNFSIQSLYFSGASIYNILESMEPFPKNISKYMIDTHLARAVSSIDEFYDSIGFGVVSRALYRKSLLDYFELLDSGFSHDDIQYAVRWTFKNSRSRPESFSLVKHTMHLALDDLIRDLKNVSGEKEIARIKKEKVDHILDREKQALKSTISSEEMQVFKKVLADLKDTMNMYSYQAFIEPLRLMQVEGERIVIFAPPDSVSWVKDHYSDRINETYSRQTGRDIVVEIH
ncbi:MAG: DnaA N-terminal domain-containing protein [Candidatus Latescibacter sp.]|nr:DnaA N-terminal domain-containing protein [Candidatus Latescibacter sp.]